jgi:hypothetical protein
MEKKILTSCLLFSLLLPFLTNAHPGRTDSRGCHTCRTNCASWGLSSGEYHCHRSKGLPQPKEPVTSTKNEGGIGSTVPAPEYKTPKTENTNKLIEKSIEEKTPVNNNETNNKPVPAVTKTKSDVKKEAENDNTGAVWFWTTLIGTGTYLIGKKKGKKN